MTEQENKILNQETACTSADETALMIEGLYNGIVASLKKLKTEICNEMKYSSLQTNGYCEMMQKESTQMVAKNHAMILAVSKELKYGYQQNQMIHEDLVHLISDDLFAKIDTFEGKLEALAEIEKIIPAIEEASASLTEKIETLSNDDLVERIKEIVASTYETVDYTKINDMVESSVMKSENAIVEQTQEILNAINGQSVDYTRIVEEVSERVLGLLREEFIVCEEEIIDEDEPEEVVEETATMEEVEEIEEFEDEKPVVSEVDYDTIVERTAEKVVESLPYAEKIDYKQIEEIVQAVALDVVMLADEVADKVAEKMPQPDYSEMVDYNRIAELVAENAPVPEMIDYERLAETVISKMPVPEAIDYEALSDMIVSKMPKPVEPAPVDYETLAEMVAAKMVAPTYDVVLDAEGVEKVALGVCENLNVDAIAEKVVEKLNYDRLADMVAERLALNVEFVSEPVEENVEEVVEEPVEENVEEVCEETVEAPVEEIVEEPVEELAVAQAPEYMEEGGELVDAETGMVLRLKRSFTAKLKQSDEEVKVFYDMIKNELASYKKVKSTVSWLGDRFNLGRATIAKMNICGKTLCCYLALDPEDPELKTTVYHQKNVGDQKAYQATPFRVKIKSEMGAKRAVRLVGILAEKIGAIKNSNYVNTDYVEEFAYETTKELLNKGLIKETKEKKIAFEF